LKLTNESKKREEEEFKSVRLLYLPTVLQYVNENLSTVNEIYMKLNKWEEELKSIKILYNLKQNEFAKLIAKYEPDGEENLYWYYELKNIRRNIDNSLPFVGINDSALAINSNTTEKTTIPADKFGKYFQRESRTLQDIGEALDDLFNGLKKLLEESTNRAIVIATLQAKVTESGEERGELFVGIRYTLVRVNYIMEKLKEVQMSLRHNYL
jgi:hypothetical protein